MPRARSHLQLADGACHVGLGLKRLLQLAEPNSLFSAAVTQVGKDKSSLSGGQGQEGVESWQQSTQGTAPARACHRHQACVKCFHCQP